jgi:transcription termination factor Rho
MHLSELKAKSPADLLSFAEELQIENASSLRKQDIMFAILKQLAENEQAIYGEGTLEILSDGFGFLRSPQANFLPGPDDIYVSPAQVRRFGLRTGDTVEGRSARPRTASATSRCSRSTPSTSSRPRRCASASTSTT